MTDSKFNFQKDLNLKNKLCSVLLNKNQCMAAKFRGLFSQVQLVNLKNKNVCTSPRYISMDKKKKKVAQADYGEKKSAVRLKKTI